MIEKEWTNLGRTLKNCVKYRNTLHFDYDARLAQIIEPYYHENLDPIDYPDGLGIPYRNIDGLKWEAAIDRWIKAQRDFECKREESTLLVRGVTEVNDVRNFPDWKSPRQKQAKALFDVASRAIEIFQQTPTALVLFPNLRLPDSRVFGGFYGSPWSTFNNQSLCMKFRDINHHFQIHVCTLSERRFRGSFLDEREIGILFTYVK
jgi:hypothetical protein